MAKINRVNIAITGDSKGLAAATDAATRDLRRLQAQTERTQKRIAGMRGGVNQAAESLAKLGVQSRVLGGAGGILGLAGMAAMGPAGLGLAAAATASWVPPAPLADMSRSTRLRESSFIASTRSGPSGAFSLPVASGDGNRKLPPVPGVWSNPLPPAIFADAGVFIASETAADPSPACCHRTSRTPPLMCAAIVYSTALPPP